MTILTNGIDWGSRLSGEAVTYFFAPPRETYATPVGRVTTEQWTAYERQQFAEALATFETFTNLDFTEASSRQAADLTLVNWAGERTDRSASSALRATKYAGTGAFNDEGRGWDGNPGGGLEQGGYGFITMIHEVGHGLGLAHPHDRGGTSTVFPGVTERLRRLRRLRPEPGHLHHDVLQRRLADRAARHLAERRLRLPGHADGDRHRRAPGEVRRQHQLPPRERHLHPADRQRVRHLLQLPLGRRRHRHDPGRRDGARRRHRPPRRDLAGRERRGRFRVVRARHPRRLHDRQRRRDRERRRRPRGRPAHRQRGRERPRRAATATTA